MLTYKLIWLSNMTLVGLSLAYLCIVLQLNPILSIAHDLSHLFSKPAAHNQTAAACVCVYRKIEIG